MTRARDVADTQDNLGGAVAPFVGAKNFLLNGSYDIWQRGTSISTLSGTAQVYTADRWWYSNSVSGVSGTVSRQPTNDTTNLPFIQYCARVQRTAGNTNTNPQYFAQDIETINSIPFAGKTITFSWYARKGADYSPTSNALSYQIRSGTGTDQNMYSGYTNSTNLINTNVTLTATWQRFTATVFVGSTATQLGIFFYTIPTGTAGANDYFEVTGMQIELGAVATPFARAGGSIGGELALCQRYYVRSTAGSNFQSFGTGSATSTTQAYVNVVNPVTMRVAPTSVDFSTLAVLNAVGSQQAVSGLALSFAGSFSSMVQATVGASLVAGNGALLVANNSTSAYIGFSAEL